MTLAGASGTAGGRHDRGDASHAGQSGGLSTTAESEARSGVPLVPNGGHSVSQERGDEQPLLRSILDTLERGDRLVGDAFYATYFLLCTLRTLGIDAVFEQYGARQRRTDFRCGQQLGPRDHL